MQEIQEQMLPEFAMWVGIPHVPFNSAAIGLQRAVERISESLNADGLPKDHSTLYAGHSLGGAMLPSLLNDTTNLPVGFSEPSGLVLMGAFLTRSFKTEAVPDQGPGQYTFPTCPVLTIGAELDGLCRISRIAEARHTQVDMATDPAASAQYFPVTLIEGMSHMQFASGEPPELVLRRDLIPELSDDAAHKAVASDFAAFAKSRMGVASSTALLTERLEASYAMLAPLVQALQLEGYHQFKPPCYCEAVDEYGGLEFGTCPHEPGCQADAPWTVTSQAVMAGGVKGLEVSVADSQHIVTEEDPSCHLPHIHDGSDPATGVTHANSVPSDNPGNGNSAPLCAHPSSCRLNMTTVTQAAYTSGTEWDLWRLVLGDDAYDTGYLPISARELKTKMKSREASWQAANVTSADVGGTAITLEALDSPEARRCAEVNAASLEHAYAMLPEKTRARYDAVGQKMVVKEGPDKKVCTAGPCWIWASLVYEDHGDDGIQLWSPTFAEENKNPFPCGEKGTTDEKYLPCPAGMHYCKVVSPARVVEWMYTDSMRLHNSLESQVVPEPKCCTSCDTDAGLSKFWSIDDHFDRCGEACIPTDQYDFWHKFEKNLLPADGTNTPCADAGYPNYLKTLTHGRGAVSMEFDMYTHAK